MTLERWLNSAGEEEIEAAISITNKRFWIFLLLGLIPFLNLIFMGCAIFCHNNLRILKSRGRKQPGGLFFLLMLLYGLIIPPIIIVQACAHIRPLSKLVLGWG